MKISPVTPILEFKQYKIACPKCGWCWWFTENQLKRNRLKFVCDCGACFVPCISKESLSEIDFSKTESFTSLVMSLVKWGYSRKEAKTRIEKVFNPSKKSEDILREAIFYDTTRLETD